MKLELLRSGTAPWMFTICLLLNDYTWLHVLLCFSLISRLFPTPNFNHLQFAKYGGGRFCYVWWRQTQGTTRLVKKECICPQIIFICPSICMCTVPAGYDRTAYLSHECFQMSRHKDCVSILSVMMIDVLICTTPTFPNGANGSVGGQIDGSFLRQEAEFG